MRSKYFINLFDNFQGGGNDKAEINNDHINDKSSGITKYIIGGFVFLLIISIIINIIYFSGFNVPIKQFTDKLFNEGKIDTDILEFIVVLVKGGPDELVNNETPEIVNNDTEILLPEYIGTPSYISTNRIEETYYEYLIAIKNKINELKNETNETYINSNNIEGFETKSEKTSNDKYIKELEETLKKINKELNDNVNDPLNTDENNIEHINSAIEKINLINIKDYTSTNNEEQLNMCSEVNCSDKGLLYIHKWNPDERKTKTGDLDKCCTLGPPKCIRDGGKLSKYFNEDYSDKSFNNELSNSEWWERVKEIICSKDPNKGLDLDNSKYPCTEIEMDSINGLRNNNSSMNYGYCVSDEVKEAETKAAKAKEAAETAKNNNKTSVNQEELDKISKEAAEAAKSARIYADKVKALIKDNAVKSDSSISFENINVDRNKEDITQKNNNEDSDEIKIVPENDVQDNVNNEINDKVEIGKPEQIFNRSCSIEHVIQKTKETLSTNNIPGSAGKKDTLEECIVACSDGMLNDDGSTGGSGSVLYYTDEYNDENLRKECSCRSRGCLEEALKSEEDISGSIVSETVDFDCSGKTDNSSECPQWGGNRSMLDQPLKSCDKTHPSLNENVCALSKCLYCQEKEGFKNINNEWDSVWNCSNLLIVIMIIIIIVNCITK